MITNKKILAIFNMYDSDGIADEYIFCLLDALNSYVDSLIIVCNGMMREDTYKRFQEYTNRIFIRENIGYDSAAYKDVLSNFIGWEKVNEYDSLILFNNTFFGPIYPLVEMFTEMESRNLDFWGVTKQKPWHSSIWGHITEHLQAYFLFVNNKLLHSSDFRKFWDEQNGTINNYKDAVFQFELRFTEYLGQKGYKWDSYIDYPFYMECNNIEKNFTQIYHVNYQFIKEKRCPFLKRKAFSMINIDYDMNEDIKLTFHYIDKYTTYDINLIWDNILRTQNIEDVQQVMHLNFVIPDNNSCLYLEKVTNAIVLVLISNLEEIEDGILKRLEQIAKWTDICICILDNFVGKEKYIHKLKNISNQCIVQCFGEDKNKYKEVYLSLFYGELKRYRYIGLVEDQAQFDNMIPSLFYLTKVLRILSENQRIDLLIAYMRHRDKYAVLSENMESLSHPLWCKRDFFEFLVNERGSCSIMDMMKKRKTCFGFIQTTAYLAVYIMDKQEKLENKIKTLFFGSATLSDLKVELVLEQVKKTANVFSEIYIYGGGAYGKKIAQMMQNKNVKYAGFLVSKQQGEVKLYGHKVYGIDEINFDEHIGIVLAIKNIEIQKNIKDLLKKKNFNFENLFIAT